MCRPAGPRQCCWSSVSLRPQTQSTRSPRVAARPPPRAVAGRSPGFACRGRPLLRTDAPAPAAPRRGHPWGPDPGRRAGLRLSDGRSAGSGCPRGGRALGRTLAAPAWGPPAPPEGRHQRGGGGGWLAASPALPCPPLPSTSRLWPASPHPGPPPPLQAGRAVSAWRHPPKRDSPWGQRAKVTKSSGGSVCIASSTALTFFQCFPITVI